MRLIIPFLIIVGAVSCRMNLHDDDPFGKGEYIQEVEIRAGTRLDKDRDLTCRFHKAKKLLKCWETK